MAQLKSTNITGNLAVSGNVVASKIIKLGGTANDILCADGTTTTLSGLGAGTVTSVGISNGGGLSVSGSPITGAGTITISHADTSSQSSMTTGGRTYVNSITLDEYGHVTAIGTGTESNQDLTNYVTLDTTQTISGKKTFSGGLAITSADQNTNMIYFLGIDAFASGGAVKWTNKSDIKLPYSQITGTPTIPNPTNYYWANVKVSASSNTSTTPIVKSLGVSDGSSATAAVKATWQYNSTTDCIELVWA